MMSWCGDVPNRSTMTVATRFDNPLVVKAAEIRMLPI